MSTAVEDNEKTMTMEPEAPVATETKPQVRPSRGTRPNPQVQPPHAVVLHNDDINTMEFVVETIQKVFRYDLAKAVQLMLQVHYTGQAVVWSGAKEHAELKADQIISRGPDPMMKHRGAGTLRVTIEPMPG